MPMMFNNQVRPHYGPSEVEAQGVRDTFSTEDLLNLYLGLPEAQRKQKFATTSEAAGMVGLSRRTIQLWIEMGFVAAVMIGRKYRLSLDSLRAYLKRRADY